MRNALEASTSPALKSKVPQISDLLTSATVLRAERSHMPLLPAQKYKER